MSKKIITQELSFEERAKGYEEDLKSLIEKWGVAPWAGLQSSQEMIVAVTMVKDLRANEPVPAP